MENKLPVVTGYQGRFAPSPTGPLHFGSLVAAIGSYLEAKANGGQWLVRIEDLDLPRNVPGATVDILQTLEKLGMAWDGEVIYQSQRHHIYQDALDKLKKNQLIYPCVCTRKEVINTSTPGPSGPIYSGTCRNRLNNENQSNSALRVKTENRLIKFTDALNGIIHHRIDRDTGDFVLQRADGVFTYQLAVVVDDAAQKITHIVRGADLLDSTPRQIYLQQLLGFTTPTYMHLPIVKNDYGEKLSKQTKAAPIDLSNAVPQLIAAMQFLGQRPPVEISGGDIHSFWQWAINNWQSKNVA